MADRDEEDASAVDSTELKPSSSFQQMLESIAKERINEIKRLRLEDDFVMVAGRNDFWTILFEKNFLDGGGGNEKEDDLRDDLLFYVRKIPSTNSRIRSSQTEIEVYRRKSKNLPNLEDTQIDWEETVYLNIILQQFEYKLTCAVCTRTGAKQLQILKKFSQRVYASPSKRQMDGKGTEEEITYPNIFFTIDNFEDVFSDIVVRDSEMVCVELVACDKNGALQGVIFLGSIRYEALKGVYDARSSLTSKFAQRVGLVKGHKRVEFVRMRGPQAKGHAEMAVSRVKGSGPETPDIENFPVNDFDDENGASDDPYSQRRMSDPSTMVNAFTNWSFRKKGMRKSRSETQSVDGLACDGTQEVEAGTLTDELENNNQLDGFIGKSFGQAWYWFKERRRANSVALNAYLTYVTLPWHRIIGDVLDLRQEPVLTFL
ncbi:uncharacterized protein KIAA0930 homolog [Tubulanus polymorphus]|uniref:uncharacterized protein KIAA0930 homolog n=1 Tax=Tubulanus polymorphus TaxID=672921 RepID=UPI003DA47D27